MLIMVKKSFSKKLFIIVLIFICVVVLVIYLNFFSTLGLQLYDDSEKIIFVNQHSNKSAIITQSGCVYINGEKNDAQGNELGLKKPKRFNNLYNSFKEDAYVLIYDKCDAANIMLSSSGGAIVTQNNVLYVFGNNDKKIYTPVQFADNVKSAFLEKDRVYILTTNGDFGFCHLNSPDNFIILKQSVATFTVIEDSNEILVLTENNKLFLRQAENVTTTDFIELTDDIAFFSVITYYDIAMPVTSVSVVTVTGDLLCYKNIGKFSVNGAFEATFKKIDTKIRIAVPYRYGVVALNESDEILVHGNNFGMDDEQLNGKIVLQDCKSVTSSVDTVRVIKTDGKMVCYGYTNSQTYRSF